jgi:hypothetical protein
MRVPWPMKVTVMSPAAVWMVSFSKSAAETEAEKKRTRRKTGIKSRPEPVMMKRRTRIGV